MTMKQAKKVKRFNLPLRVWIRAHAVLGVVFTGKAAKIARDGQ